MGFTQTWHRTGAAFRAAARSGARRWIAISFGGFALMVEVFEAKIVQYFGERGEAFVLFIEVLFLLLLAIAIVIFVYHFITIVRRQPDPLPEVGQSEFICRVVDRHEDITRVHELSNIEWPGACWPMDMSFAIHQKNPLTTVGLFEAVTDKLVGWAEIFPLTDEAGGRIERGECTDIELTIDDILPASETEKSSYIFIATVAIELEYQGNPQKPMLRLGRYVVSHILRHFLRDADKKSTILAIVFSRNGKRMCEFIKMNRNGCYADYGEPIGKHPVYRREVNRDSLLDILGLL